MLWLETNKKRETVTGKQEPLFPKQPWRFFRDAELSNTTNESHIAFVKQYLPFKTSCAVVEVTGERFEKSAYNQAPIVKANDSLFVHSRQRRWAAAHPTPFPRDVLREASRESVADYKQGLM